MTKLEGPLSLPYYTSPNGTSGALTHHQASSTRILLYMTTTSGSMCAAREI
jgi:hypothetical protein